MTNEDTYLGDGAYVVSNNYGEVIIYTSNGIRTTNEIVLGPDELKALKEYLERENKL